MKFFLNHGVMSVKPKIHAAPQLAILLRGTLLRIIPSAPIGLTTMMHGITLLSRNRIYMIHWMIAASCFSLLGIKNV